MSLNKKDVEKAVFFAKEDPNKLVEIVIDLANKVTVLEGKVTALEAKVNQAHPA